MNLNIEEITDTERGFPEKIANCGHKLQVIQNGIQLTSRPQLKQRKTEKEIKAEKN